MDVSNFHCLFSIFEEGSFAVGDLEWVNLSGCGVSRDKLNPQQWKKDTVITVRWPAKKGQSQLYPAKILKMSADKLSLIKLRDELIRGYESEDCGRGKRKRKPLCISSDDEEPEKETIKKKTEKRPSLLSKLLEKRKEQLIDNTAVQECTNCCALKEKIKQLEEDNRRVLVHLDTINELKSMVCAMKGGLEERSTPAKHQKPAILGHPPHSSQDIQVDPLEEDVTIADGVTVNQIQLKRCNHQQPTKLVCDLLGVMFTQEELSTHSLTGLKGGASGSVKPCLDKKHVNAIFEYTLKKFPSANIKELRVAARNKLNNAGKLYRKGSDQILDEE